MYVCTACIVSEWHFLHLFSLEDPQQDKSSKQIIGTSCSDVSAGCAPTLLGLPDRNCLRYLFNIGWSWEHAWTNIIPLQTSDNIIPIFRHKTTFNIIQLFHAWLTKLSPQHRRLDLHLAPLSFNRCDGRPPWTANELECCKDYLNNHGVANKYNIMIL